MNQNARRLILIITLMLSILIAPVFTGASMMDLPEEDDLRDTDFDEDDFSISIDVPMSWIRIPVHQMLVLLRWGLSIFTLFVVYLGGRSKHRRFNDRTIDPAAVLAVLIVNLKTTLRRVVFIFNPFLNTRSKKL